MHRRLTNRLVSLWFGLAALISIPPSSASEPPSPPARGADEAETPCDVCVYGGTSAGVVAAVQAARMRKAVLLIEPGKHLGGMTSNGLGATDYGKKPAIGGIAREFYRRIARHYADPSAWKFERRDDYRSHLHDFHEDAMWYFEPHVAEAVFDAMAREAGVRVVFGERLDLKRGVRKDGPRISSIVMESGRRFRARVFIDASYEGDLMARAGVSYKVGREGREEYGETLAGVQARHLLYSAHNFHRPVDPYVVPGDPTSGLLFGVTPGGPGEEGSGDRRVQAYCFRLCMTEVPENRVPFARPDGYDPKCYELLLRHLTADGLFPDNPHPIAVEHPALGRDPYIKIMPNRKTDSNTKGALSSNLVGGSYNYPEADYAARERIVKQHEIYQKGLLWFLSNDPRVPERFRRPMQTWGLARDEFADNGHWPRQLYVREARRMVGAYVLTQHDCDGSRKSAEDSVGLGSYTMDSHTTQRYVDAGGSVRNEGTLGGKVTRPYPISYRVLTPRAEQCTNLLVPVCCSASHVGYGSLRMEPVYMILGQSAATAACLAIDAAVDVQNVPYEALRTRLAADGQVLAWSEELARQVSRPAKKSAARPTVVCLGDSITHRGYPAVLETLLEVRAVNAGVGGDTTRKALARLDRDVLAHRPDAVVLFFGANDSRLDAPRTQVPVEEYETNLGQIAARIRQADPKTRILLATMPPIDPGPYYQRHPKEKYEPAGGLEKVVARYREAAIRVGKSTSVPVLDLNLELEGRPEWMSRDGVHPSPRGNEIIARLVAGALAPLLGLDEPSEAAKNRASDGRGATAPPGAARGPVLIVAPHPDDETLGCGGLIAQRRSEGRRVVAAVLTDGRALLVRFGILTDPTPEEVSRLRKDETRRAFKILGGDPADLRFLDFENERLVQQKAEAVAKVAQILRELTPAEVYVTSPFESHPEHVAANSIVREACAAVGVNPTIYEYTVSRKKGQPPQIAPRREHKVDVSAQRAREKEALAQFRSHLGILSPRQSKPLRDNYDEYLTPVETFLVEGPAGP